MQNKNPKIFVIAGEVSGDVLGAKIMRELPDAQFIGIGGENMQAAGLATLFQISDLAVMGVVEVLAHARTLIGRINQTVDKIISENPDIVLSIDSPSFAKRVIKKVRIIQKKRGIKSTKFYHVVAPQVWAWGEKRAKKFAKLFDRLYAFFDFEVPYFTKYGLTTIPVGHPIAEGLNPVTRAINDRAQNIALIPGSRMSEVKRLLPILKSVATQISDKKTNIKYDFYIPVVETTKSYIENEIANWSVKPKLIPGVDRYKLFQNTDIAIAASGTVSVELAIMHVPAVIIYKMNPLTTWLVRRLVKIKWASLVNILLGKTIYPELLGPDATPENVIKWVYKLSTPSVRDKMISELSVADKMWVRSKPASYLIAKDIKQSV